MLGTFLEYIKVNIHYEALLPALCQAGEVICGLLRRPFPSADVPVGADVLHYLSLKPPDKFTVFSPHPLFIGEKITSWTQKYIVSGCCSLTIFQGVEL